MNQLATHRVYRRSSRRPRARLTNAFSLLETTIAMGILGIGLIMVAAIFPVALTQHRQSTEQAQAMEMVAQAKTMLHQRIDPDRLWIDADRLAAGLDSSWLVMPFQNLQVGGNWRFAEATAHADALNFAPIDSSVLQLTGTDVLSDPVVPLNDEEASKAPFRFMWRGFYRQMADGTKSFAAAICKQRRDQAFALQDMTVTTPTLNPTAQPNVQRRFPTPWRITVSRIPGTNILHSESIALQLSQLAPAGAKIMIQGDSYADFAPTPKAPAGRILTVLNAVSDNEIQVLEDVSDIVANNPTDPNDNNVHFDIWVFPPAPNSNVSPVREWKVCL